MAGAKTLIAVVMTGSLAMWTGLALAATPTPAAPGAAKSPAASPPVTTSGEKEAKESKTTRQTEKAQVVQEKGNKEKAPDRTVRGEVTAVDVAAKTLTVDVMRGKAKETIGVEVPDGVKISHGKESKTLADLKIGDKVRMKYDRLTDKLVADQIHILKAAPIAAKSETPKKSS